MIQIGPNEMLASGPIAELFAVAETELEEVIELAPDSSIRLERARQVRRLEEAIERACIEAPTCDSGAAAEIMDISPRQATKLAVADRVKAEQSVPGGPWTFDVRSCHAYAARWGRSAT